VNATLDVDLDIDGQPVIAETDIPSVLSFQRLRDYQRSIEFSRS